MLGRHQHTSPKETMLVTPAWKKAHQLHTHEKMRLKRAMNKRMRQANKAVVVQDLVQAT